MSRKGCVYTCPIIWMCSTFKVNQSIQSPLFYLKTLDGIPRVYKACLTVSLKAVTFITLLLTIKNITKALKLKGNFLQVQLWLQTGSKEEFYNLFSGFYGDLPTLPFCVSLLRHWVSLKRAQERAIWVVFCFFFFTGFSTIYCTIVSSYPVDFSSFFNKPENPLEAAVCRVVPVTVNFLYVN